MKSKNGIFTIQGKQSGPEITIMAGVHGNEKSGILAIIRLLSMIQTGQLIIKKGRLNLIFGNIQAIGMNKRQGAMNLNRAFRPEAQLSAAELKTYERIRAIELMPILRRTDALLDLHSSMNKESTPFIICEPHSYPIAAKLPVDIVSRGWDIIEAGGTDYFVNQNPIGHNYGICIECGFHDDPKGPDKAFKAAMIFLSEFGCISPQKKYEPSNKKQRRIWANYIYHTKTNFKLASEFADFQALTNGTLIGYDGKKEVYSENDGVIIFPHDCEGPNDEAFIFGIEE